MNKENIQYSKLQLALDERFTKEQKQSMYMSHYDMFESVENKCLSAGQVIVAGIIISIFRDTLHKT